MNNTAPTIAPKSELWTILGLITWGAGYLLGKNIESPRLTVELLLAHVLDCDRIQLYMNHDRPLSTDELRRFKCLLKRRLDHEPIQYIVGSANFMGLELIIGPGSLIPRPETELLVEQALILLDTMARPPARVLDVGTGSGCIAIALAHFRSGLLVDAIDSSDDALAVAKANVAAKGLAERVSVSNVDVRAMQVSEPGGTYDLIVSNPPYVSREEFNQLPPEIRLHEPEVALTDGGDGLSFYRTIAAKGLLLLRPGGAVCVEIGYAQSKAVQAVFAENGYTQIIITRDFAGIERIISCARPE